MCLSESLFTYEQDIVESTCYWYIFSCRQSSIFNNRFMPNGSKRFLKNYVLWHKYIVRHDISTQFRYFIMTTENRSSIVVYFIVLHQTLITNRPIIISPSSCRWHHTHVGHLLEPWLPTYDWPVVIYDIIWNQNLGTYIVPSSCCPK